MRLIMNYTPTEAFQQTTIIITTTCRIIPLFSPSQTIITQSKILNQVTYMGLITTAQFTKEGWCSSRENKHL